MKKFLREIILAIAVVIGLYIRIANPWHLVFWKIVRFDGNDPWYYYRLIANCVHNFPNRIWFDPFTHYPYGTYTHFGPFLVYLGAITAKILGATTSESLKSVLVFIPVVGGALLALPVYLLTKEVFGEKAGLISALLVVIIPGQLLARSILGFNDHHIWEVFWMTLTLALYLRSLRLKDYKSAILPGIAYGMYLLTWAPSFYLAIFLVLFVLVTIAVERYFEVDIENIINVTMICIGIATLMYLPFAFKCPFFSLTFYSPFQLLVLIFCMFLLFIFKILLRVRERYLKNLYPAFAFAITALAVITIFAIYPPAFRVVMGIAGVIHPTGGRLTIAEVQPFFTMSGQFSLAPAYLNFGTTFFIGFLGFLYLLYELYKRRDIRYVLLVMWSVMLFIALCGQNRFAYYFAVVCAVMSAYILDKVLEWAKLYELKGVDTKTAISILAILILFIPTFTLSYDQSKYPGVTPAPWIEALMWMRNNTPYKNFYDKYYYELYKPSPNIRKPYPYYPHKTYGVMSWWDYGHWIEAIAHRMPIANPFQQGIGNKYHNCPGAAPFFTATNESYADWIARKLNVKYVITDVEMATGKFYAMAVWAEGSLSKANRLYYIGSGIAYITPNGVIGLTTNYLEVPKNAKTMIIPIPSKLYFETMEARLHILDGCGLSHYRMVYESTPSYNTPMGFEEMIYRMYFDKVYAKEMGLPKVNVTPTGFVKIFEFVKGVKVYGRANSKYVTVWVKIRTNQGRVFIWEKRVKVVNGWYSVVVPYAQNTTYPVKPITDYYIRAGKIVKKFSVTDEQVEKGATLRIDLI